jgi:hypothetical protein
LAVTRDNARFMPTPVASGKQKAKHILALHLNSEGF